MHDGRVDHEARRGVGVRLLTMLGAGLLFFLGSCQTSLTGYRSWELKPQTGGSVSGGAPGVPFRLTKPVYFIEPTRDDKNVLTGYELKVEYVTDPKTVYWVNICPADLQENDFGLEFGANGELKSVSSTGADKSKDWIETLAAVTKGALGIYVLAEAETPTDLGIGGIATTDAAVALAGQRMRDGGQETFGLTTQEQAVVGEALGVLGVQGTNKEEMPTLQDLDLERMLAEDGKEIAQTEIVTKVRQDLVLEEGRKHLFKSLQTGDLVEAGVAIQRHVGTVSKWIDAKVGAFSSLTGAADLPRVPKATEVDPWSDYLFEMSRKMSRTVAKLPQAERLPARRLMAQIQSLIGIVLVIKRGPQELFALLDDIVREASKKKLSDLEEKSPWLAAARELIDPRFAIMTNPDRDPFWLMEVAARRAKLGKVLKERRETLLLGTGEETRDSLYTLICSVRRGLTPATTRTKDSLEALGKKLYLVRTEYKEPSPAKLPALCDPKWNRATNRLEDWDLTLAKGVSDRAIEEELKNIIRRAKRGPKADAEIANALEMEFQPLFVGYAFLLSRHKAMSAKSWRDLIVKQRWDAYVEQQRIDVYGGEDTESDLLKQAEAELYMALGQPNVHLHLSRLRELLKLDLYIEDRANPDGIDQVEDLAKARTQIAEIESSTAKRIGEHLPALKVAADKVAPPWVGGGRVYPRYIYYDGPPIDDYEKWLQDHELKDLKDGEYIVIVERYAPDRQEYAKPPKPDLPESICTEVK